MKHSHVTLAALLVIMALAGGFGAYSYHRYTVLQKAERRVINVHCNSDEASETPEGQIAQDIHYRNLDLGGLTYEEASRVLEEQTPEQLENLGQLKLTYTASEESLAENDKGYVELSPYELGLRLDIPAILQEAKAESSKLFGRKLALTEVYRLDESAFEAAFNALREQVDQEGRDARAVDFDVDTAEFVFEDELPGRELEQDEAKRQIRQRLTDLDFRSALKLPVKHTAPGRSAAELRENLGLVASSSTPILEYSEPRNHNVALAAERISGTIIQPGESFSYKEVIGGMTEEAGYVAAGVQDAYGNSDLGMGGGLCQPSTTLYIAAVRADMRIDQHNFHTQPVPYSPIGTDCMVSDWSDFVFTNVSDYPYVIMSYFDGSTLSFSFYGPEHPDDTSIDLYVEFIEEIPPEEEPLEEEDKSLEPGETEVKVKPRPAQHVKVYKRYFGSSGEVLKSELMYDHTYPSFPGVNLVNKPKESSETSTNEANESTSKYAPTAPQP